MIHPKHPAREAWLAHLRAMVDAAGLVRDRWPYFPGEANGYPAELPSFDEHVAALEQWLDTEENTP